MGNTNGCTPLDFNGEGVFDLDVGILDTEFRTAAKECIAAQKIAAREAVEKFVPSPLALTEVSERALFEIMEQGKDIHGIATDRNISNVIAFGGHNVADAVRNDVVATLREKVDARMQKIAKSIFPREKRLEITSSGHFWYPPGSYMGWHTNSGVPGWRVYINYAEEEGKSFLRYKYPQTSEIFTLQDKEWNIRLFRITRDRPLWHAVYSNTNRFSIGYMIYQRSLKDRVLGRLSGMFKK